MTPTYYAEWTEGGARVRASKEQGMAVTIMVGEERVAMSAASAERLAEVLMDAAKYSREGKD